MSNRVKILLFGVLDLFATIRQPPGDIALLDVAALSADGAIASAPDVSEGLPMLAKLLDSFAKRPIVRDLDKTTGGDTTVEVVQTRYHVG